VKGCGFVPVQFGFGVFGFGGAVDIFVGVLAGGLMFDELLEGFLDSGELFREQIDLVDVGESAILIACNLLFSFDIVRSFCSHSDCRSSSSRFSLLF
jgi:hypothetical protein